MQPQILVYRCMWLLLFAACQYSPPSADSAGDDDQGPDSGMMTTPPTPGRACGVADTTLCLELEQDTNDFDLMDRAFDGSGHLHDASATNVIATRRRVTPQVTDDKAAGFGLGSRLDVADDLAIDQSFTVEMWIQILPDLTGQTSRRWLIDSNGRFFMSVGADRKVRCGINFNGTDDAKQRLDTQQTITDNNWHHVACTFDPSATLLKIYIDGSTNDCAAFKDAIRPAAGATTIGAPHLNATASDHMVGALDSIRVYPRTLDDSAICSLWGRGACSAQCQPSNSGGGGGFGVHIGGGG